MPAKKKRQRKPRGKNRTELLPAEELKTAGMIETALDIESITLKGKRWSARLKIRTLLPRSYHRYTIKLDLDERPYEKRIDDLERELEAGLFSKERTSRREVNKKIGEIRDELETMKKSCEHIEFPATVEQLTYRDGDTLVSLRIPDDVIEPLNRQKYRIDAYRVQLDPIHSV